nr:uncharacterized protein LOC116426085 [Nomia melanderi]
MKKTRDFRFCSSGKLSTEAAPKAGKWTDSGKPAGVRDHIGGPDESTCSWLPEQDKGLKHPLNMETPKKAKNGQDVSILFSERLHVQGHHYQREQSMTIPSGSSNVAHFRRLELTSSASDRNGFKTEGRPIERRAQYACGLR